MQHLLSVVLLILVPTTALESDHGSSVSWCSFNTSQPTCMENMSDCSESSTCLVTEQQVQATSTRLDENGRRFTETTMIHRK